MLPSVLWSLQYFPRFRSNVQIFMRASEIRIRRGKGWLIPPAYEYLDQRGVSFVPESEPGHPVWIFFSADVLNPALAAVVLFFIRIALEDRTLFEKL